jgi:hypothetical protein
MLPVVGVFSKVGMAARDDGTFVLVGLIAERSEWIAFQFRLSDRDHIQWSGSTHGSGFILHDPFFSDAGLLLPVQRGTSVDFVDLSPQAFRHEHEAEDHEECTRL